MSGPGRPKLITAVKETIARLEALELHASRAGREIMRCLTETARSSSASDTSALADEIQFAVDAILRVMPPYAPALNVMHRVLARVELARTSGEDVGSLRMALESEASSFSRWSASARQRIADYGAELIPADGTVFTFTLSETILRCLLRAAERGKRFRILVTESRPNNDGLATASALFDAGLDIAVSIDACIAELLPQADVMMVGAEAIMADGSAIAKAGAFPCALAARQFGIPVYVVVDSMKLDVSSALGLSLPQASLNFQDILPADAPEAVAVAGSLFDRSPAHLIRGVVSERGILTASACSALMREMPVSQYLHNAIGERKGLHV